MNYQLKNIEKREFIMYIIIAVMAGVIIAQTIIAVTLYTSVSKAKTMYEEALDERVQMQEEINRLINEETSNNYSDDIPFVTEGGEELSLPTQP